MSNFGIEWFSLKNYQKVDQLNYADWLFEVTCRKRALDAFYGRRAAFISTPDIHESTHSFYQSKFEKLRNEAGLSIINNIKKYGLISLNLNMNDSERIEQSKDYLINKKRRKKAVKELGNQDMPFRQKLRNQEGREYLALLKIDLNAHQDHIKEDFKLWLDGQMKLRNARTKKHIDEQIYRCKAYNILAYWDLKNISQIDGLELSAQEIGEILFPTDSKLTVSDRVRKTVIPQCESFFSDETITLLSYLM